jgi:signal transduction histidine kinase
MKYAGTLARIVELSTRTGGEHDAIEKIVEETAALFGSGMASVFQLGQDGRLKHLAGLGVPPHSIRKLEEAGSANRITSLLDGSGQPAILQHTKELEINEAGIWDGLLDAATMALVPLQSEGATLGVLILFHKTPYNYAPDECAILQVASALASPVVARIAEGNGVKADFSKSQLFSVLSHELRTPLTSIMGFTQLIRKRLSASAHTDQRTMEQLDVLWAQAQRLNRLIDTFVDMNRIERGEFEITRGQVELTSLLKAATSQAGAQHEISMDLPDRPLWVHGDSKRLEQVFSHILSNALRYAPQGQPIRLSCKADTGEGSVTVKVTDRGPGIPPARLKEVFARKYPGGPLKAGGLGVGLYLSKVIVEAHGGRISIESSSAKGTVVEVVLPV